TKESVGERGDRAAELDHERVGTEGPRRERDGHDRAYGKRALAMNWPGARGTQRPTETQPSPSEQERCAPGGQAQVAAHGQRRFGTELGNLAGPEDPGNERLDRAGEGRLRVEAQA